jgi:hypothetical protein
VEVTFTKSKSVCYNIVTFNSVKAIEECLEYFTEEFGETTPIIKIEVTKAD